MDRAVTSKAGFSEDLGSRPLAPWQRTLMYAFALVVAALAAWVKLFTPYAPTSTFAYYLGVAGGSMMLVLIAYALRKHWGRLHHAGPLRKWFSVHVAFGVLAPVLILFHTSFQLRSFNASVAFWSMVLVAFSGAIGRFLYIRVGQGLGERHASLYELEGMFEPGTGKSFHALDLAPEVREWLNEFRRFAFSGTLPYWKRPLRFLAFGLFRRRLGARAHAEVRRALKLHGRKAGWTDQRYVAERNKVLGLIDEYLRSIEDTRRLARWERLLAWWHIAHVPVVYVLVLSAIAHIVAVHVY